MFEYRWKTCSNITKFASKLARGETRDCSQSGCPSKLTSLDFSMKRDLTAYDGEGFVSDTPKTKKTRKPVTGRSQSAPAAQTAWGTTALPLNWTYVSDLSDPTWTLLENDASVICLIYSLLDINTAGPQGLAYSFAGAQKNDKVRDHFNACTAAMKTAHKATDVTEATGEIAAAIGMLSEAKYRNYNMIWGFDEHSGTGFDQIWSHGKNYVVVEAKGPNQLLSTSVFTPRDYDQMDVGWIVDRLFRMCAGAGATIANQIIGDLSLTKADAYPHWGGASKSYSGCTQGTSPAGTLHGVTIQAKWEADRTLSYRILRTHTYDFSKVP